MQCRGRQLVLTSSPAPLPAFTSQAKQSKSSRYTHKLIQTESKLFHSFFVSRQNTSVATCLQHVGENLLHPMSLDGRSSHWVQLFCFPLSPRSLHGYQIILRQVRRSFTCNVPKLERAQSNLMVTNTAPIDVKKLCVNQFHPQVHNFSTNLCFEKFRASPSYATSCYTAQYCIMQDTWVIMAYVAVLYMLELKKLWSNKP